MKFFIYLLLFSVNALGQTNYCSSDREVDLSHQLSSTHYDQTRATCYLHTAVAASEAALFRQFKLKEPVKLNDMFYGVTWFSPLERDSNFPDPFLKTYYSFLQEWMLLAPYFGEDIDFEDYGESTIVSLGLKHLPVVLKQDSAEIENRISKTKSELQKALNIKSNDLPAGAPARGSGLLNLFPYFGKIDRKAVTQKFNDASKKSLEFLSFIKNNSYYSKSLSMDSFRSSAIQLDFASKEMAVIGKRVGSSGEQEGDRKRCEILSQNLVNQVQSYLCKGVPVMVIQSLAGIEFSREGIDGPYDITAGGQHAMLLVARKRLLNESGELVEYFIFRDSGVIEDTKYARLPVELACKFKQVGVITVPSDSL